MAILNRLLGSNARAEIPAQLNSFDSVMRKDFKIHCIALTKNEADVVGYCLKEAAKWADFIYVYDGASTDATWDIVKSLKSEKIIPWKQDGKVFKEGLRAEVFEAFRHKANSGDWWLQLNVDEFYPDSPRQFFYEVPRGSDFVWGINIEYYITDEDLEYIDFTQPVEDVLPKMRYYRVNWSEPRAFRYRNGLVWSTEWAWPIHVGLVSKRRIHFKHYPYRSPKQIQTRLDVRRDNRARGFEGWDHAKQLDWREKIVPGASCEIDDDTGHFRFNEFSLPRHLERPSVRLVKRFLHATNIWP